MGSLPDLQQTIERLSTTLASSGAHGRVHREERRDLHQHDLDNASLTGGAFRLFIALVLFIFTMTHLQYWWLLFIAVAIGLKGARQFNLAKERELEPSRRGSELSVRPHEIDVLCDQLLADLEQSPEAVRSFLQQPEQTVEALRATAKAVDQRRGELARMGTAGQLAALERQRQDLHARRDASSDPQARAKFDGALHSLDGQEAALELLLAVGDRLDGEYTSLLVLLQELKTRVAVARSTNTASQLEGLEHNVQRLNAELQAITESLVMTPIDEGVLSSRQDSPAGIVSPDGRDTVGRRRD